MRLALAGAAVSMFLMGLVTALLGAAAPFTAHRFEIGVAASGLPVSVYSAGSMVTVLVCGIAGRRVNPTWAITVSLTAFALGSAGLGLASGWFLYLAAAGVAGAGFGGLVLFLNTAFSKGFGKHDVLVLNLLNAIFGIGAIIGPLAAGAAQTTGLGIVFASAAVACLPALVARNAGQLIESRQAVADGSIRKHLPIIVGFAAVFFSYAGVETGTGAWASSYLVASGHPEAQAAAFTALYWAGLTAGRIVMPLAGLRLSPKPLVTICVVLSMCGLGLTMLPGLGPAGFAITGFAIGPIFPTTFVWMANTLPTSHTAGSILLTAGTAGNTVLPAMIGLTVGVLSPLTIPATIIAIGLAMLVAIQVTQRVSVTRRP
ncbi:MFS transporter [Amycolatopsis sp. NPDC059657]|uniref:MFS transporter n=1 Tax=Amycolatopsis sp. NPDC059657 TaxID=3346899 RepID=UPI00366A7343